MGAPSSHEFGSALIHSRWPSTLIQVKAAQAAPDDTK